MQIDAYLEEVNLRLLSSNQTESMCGPVTKLECWTNLLNPLRDKSILTNFRDVAKFLGLFDVLVSFYTAINKILSVVLIL